MAAARVFSDEAIAAAIAAVNEYMREEPYSFSPAKRRAIRRALQSQDVLEIDWFLVYDAIGTRPDEFRVTHPAAADFYGVAYALHRASLEYEGWS